MTDAWLKSNLASSKKLDSGGRENSCRAGDPLGNFTQAQNTRPSQQVVRQFTPIEKDKQREISTEILPCHEVDQGLDPQNKDEYEDDSIIEVIGVEKEDVATSSTNMAFMKSLIDPNSKKIFTVIISLNAITNYSSFYITFSFKFLLALDFFFKLLPPSLQLLFSGCSISLNPDNDRIKVHQ